MDDGPGVALLQSAVATLMARYALHRQDCIAAAVERAFLTLARHPQVPAQAAGAYEALALAWRELSALHPHARRH